MSTKTNFLSYTAIIDNVLSKIFLFPVFLILLFTSCSKGDRPGVVRIENYIESEIQPYFDSFKEEAAARNIEIDFEALQISAFLKVINGGVAGQCKTYTDQSKEIEIDPRYWNAADNLGKEFVIFHELGHCALDREHLNDKDDDGNCLSMMNGGGAFCVNNYKMENRDELLDELFSTN